MLKRALMVFGLAALALAAETTSAQVTTSAHVKGCPAGTAIQGIDFSTRRLICVPVAGDAAAFKVMDSANQQLGFLLDSNILIRLVDNEWTAFFFQQDGFGPQGFGYLWESTDCTGQAYIQDFGGMPRNAVPIVSGGFVTLYYGARETFVQRTIRSFKNFSSDTGFTDCVQTEFSAPVGVPQTATFSVTPPFHIER
jgi:hypothetical protein